FGRWVRLRFRYRWLFAILIIGVPAIFIYELLLYKKLAQAALVTPHIAPISVRAGIARQLGSRGAGFVLRSHLSAIAETFRKAKESRGTPHGEVTALVRDFPALDSSKYSSECKLEEELVIKIGNVEFPLDTIVNLLLALLRRMIPFRKRYLDLLIRVSLVSSNSQTQLVVSRNCRPSNLSNQAEAERKGRATEKMVVLTETKTVSNFTHLSGLLRDAAFMIFQVMYGSDLPGRNWLGMKYFVDGLEILDDFQRTDRHELKAKATKSFSRACEADVDSYKALYICGEMLLSERTKESINRAIKVLTRVSKVDDPKLRILVNAALARCYAQQYHRLANREAYVLDQARKYSKEATDNLESVRSDRIKPLILMTSAVVKCTDEGKDKLDKKMSEDFYDAAKDCLEAIASDKNNVSYYNLLGWILMKLAERGISRPSHANAIPEDIQGNPAEKAEKYLIKALELQFTNTFVHSNLCLLYAVPKYVKDKEKTKYLGLCRMHGHMATRLDPKYINGYRDLTLSLLRHGEFAEAHESFETALQLARSIENKPDEIIKDVTEVFNRIKISAEEKKRWDKLSLDP
ncbi:MAG: tetratricopeptide repeat protein, partial [Planctomycetota bacterium]